jgi:DNA-directed RNA polymerase I subunit RPA1
MSRGGGGLSTENSAAVVIRREISGVKFGFYDDDDVISRSVVQVVSPVAFDALGNHLKGGLYDPLLGPIQPEGENCKTCGNPYLYCPGHTGHIALAVPVYHIFTFPHLLKLLRAKCLYCHRFRISKSLCKAYAAKLHLLDCGYVEDAIAIDEKVSLTLSKLEKSSSAATSSTSTTTITTAAEVEEFLDNCLQRTRPDTALSPLSSSSSSSSERYYRQLWIKQFFAANNAQKKCDSCNAFHHKLRHDSFNKIFMSPLSDKARNYNFAERIPAMKSALDQLAKLLKKQQSRKETLNNDDDDDTGWESDDSVNSTNIYDLEDNIGDKGDDIENTMLLDTAASDVDSPTKSNSSGDKLLHALEIEAQVKLTWNHHTLLCSKIFGPVGGSATDMDTINATRELKSDDEGYKIFFMRAIPVPPSRFRPPMATGMMVVEHAQNHYLSKMIDLNNTIVQQIDIIREHEANSKESINNMDDNDTSPKADGNKVSSTTQLSEKSMVKAKELLYQSWINLQTTVNCYIDSSKDPQISTNEANIGIKQILEKKEGLFRK